LRGRKGGGEGQSVGSNGKVNPEGAKEDPDLGFNMAKDSPLGGGPRQKPVTKKLSKAKGPTTSMGALPPGVAKKRKRGTKGKKGNKNSPRERLAPAGEEKGVGGGYQQEEKSGEG